MMVKFYLLKKAMSTDDYGCGRGHRDEDGTRGVKLARRDDSNPAVVIVGAGVKGLYAARLLNQKGYDVMVLEKGGRVGGKILTQRSACGATCA